MKTANKQNVHWQGEGLSRWDRGTGGMSSACLPAVKRAIEFKTECLMVKTWWTCRAGEGAHGDKDDNESGAVKHQDYHLQCAMELRAEQLTVIALLIWNHLIIETSRKETICLSGKHLRWHDCRQQQTSYGYLEPRLLAEEALRERERVAQVARGSDGDRGARGPGGEHECAVDLDENFWSRAACGRASRWADRHCRGADRELAAGRRARTVICDARCTSGRKRRQNVLEVEL